jgi:hypothetical protein
LTAASSCSTASAPDGSSTSGAEDDGTDDRGAADGDDPAGGDDRDEEDEESSADGDADEASAGADLSRLPVAELSDPTSADAADGADAEDDDADDEADAGDDDPAGEGGRSDPGARSDGEGGAGAPSCVHPSPVAGTSSCPPMEGETRAAVLRASSGTGVSGAASANAPSARPVSATGSTRDRRRITSSATSGATIPAAAKRTRTRSPVPLAERGGPAGAWCTEDASRSVKSRGVSL